MIKVIYPNYRPVIGRAKNGRAMNRQAYTTIVAAVVTGFLGWMAVTLIAVDKRTAVINERVNANHSMLEPMWKDYIAGKRSAVRSDSPTMGTFFYDVVLNNGN